ncbi:hypothetical protein G6F40_015252 [Rhizopus arrhizus]|nr:hypothetical protein G6F40_015252 [Rhizopus arrhizus]
MTGDDKAQTEAKSKVLEEAGQSLFAAASADQGGAAPGADAGNAGQGNDDVLEAEFTEVKDDKKVLAATGVSGRPTQERTWFRSSALTNPDFPEPDSRYEQARLLRSAGRCPHRHRRRAEEGLSSLRDEVPPGPQPG